MNLIFNQRQQKWGKIQMIFVTLLLTGCGSPFEKPLKTKEEIQTVFLKAEGSANRQSYSQAIRSLNQLEPECIRDPEVDKKTNLMKAQYAYKCGAKKANFVTGVKACDILINDYPDFAIENDVYMLKIKFYLENLDQTAAKSVENADKIVKFIDEYTEKCKSNKKYAEIFKKNKKEIEKIRLNCLELGVKKKLELGKGYIEEGQMVPALDSLTEAIEASRQTNTGKQMAMEAASLILGVGEAIANSQETKSGGKSSTFFDQEEKQYWEKERGSFTKPLPPSRKRLGRGANRSRNSRKPMNAAAPRTARHPLAAFLDKA